MLRLWLLTIFVCCSVALDPKRVHLIDAYPRSNPINLLFRGNNPIEKGSHEFNLTAVVSTLRMKAQSECNTSIPENARFFDLDLENPTDPGYFTEVAFWKQHPELGQVGSPTLPGTWMTLGSVLEPKYTPFRDTYVKNGSWAVQGHGDYLSQRINATRSLLLDITQPKILYVHCNAGCDRTGEFIAAYGLTHLDYNITTAYGEACRQCGRCPNYYATQALGWWCLTLQQEQQSSVMAARAGAASAPFVDARGQDMPYGNCLDFAGCKFLGDCDAHGATPLPDDCPARSYF